jgi:predicted nuclease of predicted toxin-antitoxin system
VILLRVGNQRTDQLEALLRNMKPAFERFEQDSAQVVLEVYRADS